MLFQREFTRILDKPVNEEINEIPFDTYYKIQKWNGFGEVAVLVDDGELKTPELKITKKYWVENVFDSPGLGLGDLIFFGLVGRNKTTSERLIGEAVGMRFDITNLLNEKPQWKHEKSHPGAAIMPLYFGALQRSLASNKK